MNHTQVIDTIGPFLSSEKETQVKEKIARFSEDEWLMSSIAGKLKDKEPRTVSLDDLVPAMNILKSIVFPNYPVENPVEYSDLYASAINSGSYERYVQILEHLNKISGVEKAIAQLGIQKNQNFGRQRNNMGIDVRLNTFEDSSYLALMSQMMSENDDTRNKMKPLGERLTDFEDHISKLKSSGINLGMIFSVGYAQVIKNLDSRHHEKDSTLYAETSEKIIKVFSRLNELGFEVYNAQNIKKIATWVGEKKLNHNRELVDFLSKEALMYVTGLHLKKE